MRTARQRKSIADAIVDMERKRTKRKTGGRTRASQTAQVRTRKTRARATTGVSTKETTRARDGAAICKIKTSRSIKSLVNHLTSIPSAEICGKYIDACKQQGADNFLSTKFTLNKESVINLNESAVSLFLSWLQDEMKKSPRKRIYKKMWNLKAPELCQLARLFMVKLASHATA